MNWFRSIGVAGRAYGSILPLIRRPSHWLPFIVIAAVQVAFLTLLVGFHRPVLSTLGMPLVHWLGGERAMHYPAFFLFLPTIFSQVSLGLAVLVSSVAGAAATLYFARSLGFELDGPLWPRVRRRIPALVLVTLPPAFILWGVGQLTKLIPGDLYLHSSMVRWGVRGGVLLVAVLVQSFVAYATAWVVLEGHAAMAALRDSARVTARTFLPTFLVVAFPILALFPLSYLAQRGDLFIGKLRPESVVGVLSLRIVGELLLGFLIVGAITRLFLWRVEASR